jgi:hypothetical protein
MNDRNVLSLDWFWSNRMTTCSMQAQEELQLLGENRKGAFPGLVLEQHDADLFHAGTGGAAAAGGHGDDVEPSSESDTEREP